MLSPAACSGRQHRWSLLLYCVPKAAQSCCFVSLGNAFFCWFELAGETIKTVIPNGPIIASQSFSCRSSTFSEQDNWVNYALISCTKFGMNITHNGGFAVTWGYSRKLSAWFIDMDVFHSVTHTMSRFPKLHKYVDCYLFANVFYYYYYFICIFWFLITCWLLIGLWSKYINLSTLPVR